MSIYYFQYNIFMKMFMKEVLFNKMRYKARNVSLDVQC